MTQSSISYNRKGEAVSFSGPEAVELFRAGVLASALPLYAIGLRYPGTISGPQALKEATKYTGVKYRRGEYEKAKTDLFAYIKRVQPTIPSKIAA
jgi:hypothetical protein